MRSRRYMLAVLCSSDELGLPFEGLHLIALAF